MRVAFLHKNNTDIILTILILKQYCIRKVETIDLVREKCLKLPHLTECKK